MHTKDTLKAGQTYIIGPEAMVFTEDGSTRKYVTENTGILVHSVSDATYPSWARVSIGTEMFLILPSEINDLSVEQNTEAKVGDTVHLKAGGVFTRPGEYSGKRLYPDDDLLVTRVTTHKLFVRKGETGSFWIDKDKFTLCDLKETDTDNAVTPAEGDIAIDDPRIAWIWKKAARLADDLDFCEEYDNIAAKLGVTPRARERSVVVRFPDTDGVSTEPMWVTVLAATDDEAIDKAKALLKSEGNTYTVEVD